MTMWRGGLSVLGVAILLYQFVGLLDGQTRTRNSRNGRFDECILFKSNTSYLRATSESYLELGYYDIPGNREFEISFEVLPSREDHNGPLFAIGTEGFSYYEWKTKAVKAQFLVIEFFYSALSTLMKPLGEEHLYQLEIHRTHPDVYNIDDGEWHRVRVFREIPMEGRGMQQWHLELDNLELIRNQTEETNIDMYDCKAYLGGRPGYRSSQFRGILRNLFINGERVPLRGKATYGLTEVWHCSAPEVQKFIEELQGNAPEEERGPPPGWSDRAPASRGTRRRRRSRGQTAAPSRQTRQQPTERPAYDPNNGDEENDNE